MGHLRLGRLPKTRRWNEVVQLLDTSPEDTAGIAAAVVVAAERRLRYLASDPSVGYSFWLLTRIDWASRNPQFQQTLSDLGIKVDDRTSFIGFISRLTEHVSAAIASNTSSGHFAELSSLAIRRTLSEAVAQSAGSLFDTSIDNLQQAFLAHSTPDAFGKLSHKFFGDFFARTLSSLVDRELSSHVGQGRSFSSCDDSESFSKALDLHARESARIMESLAVGWYATNSWNPKRDVSKDEAQAFVKVALGKLRKEFRLGATGQ